MIVVFTEQEYEVRESGVCNQYYGPTDGYKTLVEAKAKCSDNSSCAMVWDKGTKFFLCDDGAEIRPTNGSRLHLKKGKYIYICISF